MKYKFLQAYEPVVDTCPADSYFETNISNQAVQTMQRMAPAADATEFTTFVGDQYDAHYLANIGWEKINETNTGYRMFFSKENMDRISCMITQQLARADLYMVVTPRVIGGIMSDILRNHTPEIGDMYTQYTIPSQRPRNDLANLNERVVNVIVNTIVNEEDARKWNESLNIWDTVYGDFNRRGLRAHAVIRKKDNDYLKGQFNMNY
jgi:hypothetical protein